MQISITRSLGRLWSARRGGDPAREAATRADSERCTVKDGSGAGAAPPPPPVMDERERRELRA
jgi:hypothetical protein